MAESFQRLLEQVTEAVLPRKSLPRGTRKPNFWWSQDIADARRASLRARRWFQRRRKKRAPDADEARREYARAKKELQVRIWRAKEAHWKELCAMVDLNPWGKPYKVVMATLKGRAPRSVMSTSQARSVISGLFQTSPPTIPPASVNPRAVSSWVTYGIDSEVLDALDEDLIKNAVAKVKPSKAPGLDSVPSQVVACVLRTHQDHFREMVVDTLRRARIPASWKTARVVLIPKPGKDLNSPSGFRPISILPALSKAWEYAIKGLIEKYVGTDPFHRAQYGFRKGVGTVDASLEVTEFARECGRKNRLCALVTIDVRNAFNSLSWDVIMEELGRRRIPTVIQAVIRNYFQDRRIVVHTAQERIEAGIWAGVPQGSVLGPFLWNLVYDSLLKLLDAERFVRAVAYADDLALVFSTRDQWQFKEDLSRVMSRVSQWFLDTGLQIAVDKTEIVLLTGLRGDKIHSYSVLGKQITSVEAVKYLGIMLDCNRSFKAHLKEAAGKGDRMMGALASLLPNVGGPTTYARRLYYSVWESVMLYAAPAWASALRRDYNRAALRRAQRSALIRSTTSYRTVSFQALCVLAGRIPAHLKVGMWEKVFLAKVADRNNPALSGNIGLLKERTTAVKRRVLKEAVEEWQAAWDRFDASNWTRRLVSSVQTFLGEAGEVFQLDYWLSQLLSAHGAFNAFKVRIGKTLNSACDDCGGTVIDDAEHVLTKCPTYDEDRRTLERELGAPVEVSNVIALAMGSEEKWAALKLFAKTVMRDRAAKERAKEALARAARNRALRSQAAAKKQEAARKRGKRKGGNHTHLPTARPTKKRKTQDPVTLLGIG